MQIVVERFAYKRQLHAGFAQVDVHLLELFSDTSGLEHAVEEVVNRAVTCPLTEDSHCTVARKAVARGTVFEESTVVPPASICTIHVEILFVLVDLHCYPNTVFPAETVVLGKNLLSFVVPATSVEPARAFRQEPSQEKNQRGEENLEPDRNGPAHVSREVDGATGDTSSEERANEPRKD